jgi:hypothetical protein
VCERATANPGETALRLGYKKKKLLRTLIFGENPIFCQNPKKWQSSDKRNTDDRSARQ